MLSLGQFGDQPEIFDQHPWKNNLYFLLFITSFMTQIVFLNMIIAVMGDTFDRLVEIRPMLALSQQMQVMSYYRLMMNQQEGDDEKRFLYIVEPFVEYSELELKDEVDREDEWRGKIFQMKKKIDHTTEKVMNKVDEQV